MQLFCGIRHAADPFRISTQPFHITQRKLQLTVETLIARHGGVGSTMILQIKLAAPLWEIRLISNPFFQFLKECIGHTLPHHRRTGKRHRHPSRMLDHPVRRPAASITIAIGNKKMIIERLLLKALPPASDLGRRQHCVIGCKPGKVKMGFVIGGGIPGWREMCEHLRPVDPFPQKCIIGREVELAPAQLGCHEIIDPCFLHDLRKRCRVAEYIRQPQNACAHAELFLKELLSMQKLPHKRFPG